MLRFSVAAVALLCSTAVAQNVSNECVPCGGNIKNAGTYVLATGKLIPPDQAPPGAAPAPTQVIYNNTCNTGFFSSLLNDSTVIDDGRVPSASSTAPVGTLNNYKVNKFEIQYCTRDLTGVFTVEVKFWQGLLMNSTTCTTLTGAGTPLADFTLTNLPGSSATGTLACFDLTIDLTGFEFCLQGDADGVFGNGDPFSDGFGYGLSLHGQTGTTNANVGGFIIGGKTGTCSQGDGTYYSNPLATGTGLDDDLTFYRDGQHGQTSGCFVFGGGAAGAAGYWMKIFADMGDCAFCPGNPDNDGDGVLNCLDGCPNDPNKTAPGQCGCGVADTDTDGDGVADCVDGCPFDAAKTAPGQCGCGIVDTDSDGDGVADCIDGCPSDAGKIDPGICGCGIPDTDSDLDGTPDCNDGCPFDANKTAPGACGCGVSDVDSDGDGTPDCNDGCPNDANKTSAGQCGCGTPDIDTDGDGVADCNDGCPLDANKTVAGVCGCGTPDTDTDGDGVADCIDNCASLPNPGQEDCNGNGIGDACDLASGYSVDANGDTIPDECEQGVGTPYCFGDGSGAACPCGNNGSAGSGCANSTGFGALLYNLGGASVGADNTALYAIRLPANKFGLVYMGTQNLSGSPFGDGLRCVKGFTKRFHVSSSGAGGNFSLTGPASQASSLILAGTTWYFQAWYRDVAHNACNGQFNLSNALQIDFLP